MAASDGYMRFFPYAEPYENQREAMDRVYNALARGQDVLFEGACGTGKTLSALAPALEHARESDRTVVITTNVHQQMRQFVAEARAITRQEPIRAVVFRGKGSMCHLDVGYEECQVLRDGTYEVVDAERDRDQLERRGRQLLAEMQEGGPDGDEAAEARAAVMDELERVEADLADRRAAATCEHFYNNLTADVGHFEEWLFEDVRTPDEIYEYADDHRLCGYELLKDTMEGVELAVCNYHHLLDPFVRDRFFDWLGADPGEVIAVFDEAHNVEDAAREHARRTLAEPTLDGALEELEGVDDPRAAAATNVLAAFRDALVETYEAALEGRRVGGSWRDLGVANEDRRDDLSLAFLSAYRGPGYDRDLERALALGRELDAAYEEAYRAGEADARRDCDVLAAAEFVAAYMAEATDPGQYPVVSVRRDDRDDAVYGRAELYTCIPHDVTAELFDAVHASVLLSATLRPFDVLEDVLGLEEPASMAYGLTFPPERRRTFAVDAPPLFASERDDPEVQSVVAGVLRDAIAYTPGNALAYFPSYGEAERYHDIVAGAVDATVHLDRPGTRATELREEFAAADGDALFTSLWGTLTEGVSFDGDDARTAVVVGVPYPHLDDRMEAVQAAYAEAFGDAHGRDAGWEYAVEIPTIRRTRQALGRVLRSPTDYGVRVLVDRRYTAGAAAELGRYGVHDDFPAEERRELVDVDPGKLKFAMLNFFQDVDAYDGPPPAP